MKNVPMPKGSKHTEASREKMRAAWQERKLRKEGTGRDRSMHFKLTETRHTSIKDVCDQLDRLENGVDFLIRNLLKDVRLVQGVWRHYTKERPSRVAGFGK